jgi:hypothetical protein
MHRIDDSDPIGLLVSAQQSTPDERGDFALS